MKEAKLDQANPDQTYLHCKHCLEKFLGSPSHQTMTPEDAMEYNASAYPFIYENGTTARIFVLWCKRCKRRVWDSRHLTPLTV